MECYCSQLCIFSFGQIAVHEKPDGDDIADIDVSRCRDHDQNAGGGLTSLKQAPLKVQIWGARRHIIWQVHQARQGGRQLTNAGT